MMKTLILGVTLCALVACKDPAKEVVQVTSPAGHSFSLLPIFDEGVTDITVNVAWPTDWAHRVDVNPFVPYIGAETIMSDGTQTKPAQEVMEAFNDKNASGRVYATVDHVRGELSFPYEHTDYVIEVAVEALSDPKYSDAWLGRMKQKLGDDQAEGNKQGNVKMWHAVRYAFMGDSPVYNALTLPDATLAAEVDRATMLDWHKAVFTRDVAGISVAGRITAEDAGVLVDQLLEKLPEGGDVRPQPISLDMRPANVFLHLPEEDKTVLGMIGQLPNTADEKDYVDVLAIQMLNRAEGPMFQAVREDLRASYGVSVGIANYDRANRFMYIYAEVESDKLGQTVDVVRETYETHRTAADLSELDQERDAYAANARERSGYVNVASHMMMELSLDGHNPAETLSIADTINALTADEVQTRMAAVFPKGDDLFVIAAGPDASAWPGACVITSIEEIANCPRGTGS